MTSNVAALRTASIAQSSASPASDRAVLLAAGLVPRAARIPSDLVMLDSRDPMSHSLATLRGGEDRVSAARIRALILDALRGV